MLRIAIFGLIMSLWSLSGVAEQLLVRGRVCDNIDNEDLIGATVRLLALPDSTFMTGTSASRKRVRGDEVEETSHFRIVLPGGKDKYLLEVSYPGYEKSFVTVNPSDYSDSEKIIDLPVILLPHKIKQLGEVVVSASRIKFFNKGDTVVFNADAFQIADGSMLDVLVSQLPGVELKANGQIYYNGRYVESLPLDGKHFFNGNNQLMLENLGAYAVKNINIYEKTGEASAFAGRQLGNDKELVMDVRLKKEYSTGLIVNAEAGGGTDDRYLGRLFGMLFTPETRITVYANSNNLNDDRKPGRSDGWKPADMKTGVRKSNTGGVDYLVEKKKQNWKVNGNIQVSHDRFTDETGIYRTNFLPGSDTYDRTFRHDKSRTFKVVTSHNFYMKHKWYDLTIIPRFDYNNRRSETTTAGATFDYNIQDVTFGDLVNIGKDATGSFFSDYVNRYVREALDRSKTWNSALDANSRIKIKGTSDILRVGAFGGYNHLSEDRFDRYTIDYAENASNNQMLDRYFKNRPNHNSRIGGLVGYNRSLLPNVSMELTYRFTHSEKESNSTLFNLHEAGDYSGHSIGYLPSMAEYTATIDQSNSYMSRSRTNDHTIIPFFNFGWKVTDGNLNGQLCVPVTLSGRHLDYLRGSVDAHISHNSALWNVESTFINWQSTDKTKKIELFYSVDSEAPDLIDLVDMTDNTDPLNIYLGNTGLKSSHLHKVGMEAQFMNPRKRLMHFIKAGYQQLDNGLSKGYIYDTSTGIRTYRTYNVDGNWQANIGYGIAWQHGPMTVQSLTTGSWVNSVDLIGVDDTGPSKNKVVTKGINEILKWSYAIGKNSVGINADVTYHDYSDGADIRTWTHQYGANALWNITERFQLSTDFNIYTRSGFSDNSLNTTDFVWNARLSYSIMKGALTFMIDGFDMLHNLSNVTYTVNAQARTETYVNVLPRYFMFHVQYRFNRQPKKRKQ